MQVSSDNPHYLPPELLERIVVKLGPLERSRAACVDRSWREAATQDCYWVADAAPLQPPQGGSFKAWTQVANQTRGAQRRALQALAAGLASDTAHLAPLGARLCYDLQEPARPKGHACPPANLAKRVAALYFEEGSLPPLQHLAENRRQVTEQDLRDAARAALAGQGAAASEVFIQKTVQQKALQRDIQRARTDQSFPIDYATVNDVQRRLDLLSPPRTPRILADFIVAHPNETNPPSPSQWDLVAWRWIEALGGQTLKCLDLGLTTVQPDLQHMVRKIEERLTDRIPQAVQDFAYWELVVTVLALQRASHLSWTPGSRERLIATACAALPADAEELCGLLRQSTEHLQQILAHSVRAVANAP